MKQATIRLPDETYDRLKALVSRTGRTATFYIREAIEEHLDDLEDVYLAEQVLTRVKNGEEKIISAKEMWRELGTARMFTDSRDVQRKLVVRF